MFFFALLDSSQKRNAVSAGKEKKLRKDCSEM